MTLLLVGPETVGEPARTDGLGAQLADALTKSAVGGDENDAGGRGRGLRHQCVVAAVGGVDDTDTVEVGLGAAGAGGAFENDHYRQRQLSLSGRGAQLVNKPPGRAGPIPPPPGGLGADDVGGVDHEHASRLARRRPMSTVIGSVTVPAVNVDPGVAHRRLLDLASGLRPLQDGALLDRIGGQATVDRLVDGLYDRFEADAMIRRLFGKNLATGRSRQKRFFVEWLGGPPRHSESAWGALYQHHEDLPITRAVAERWIDHLSGALNDAVAAPDAAAHILERARAVALALVNSEEDQGGRASGKSRHRSERIASCGVGARTVKQAVRQAQRGHVGELATLVADVPDLLERALFAGELLQRATLASRIEVVDWLLDRGVDANTPFPLDVRLVGGAFELVLFVTPLGAAGMKRESEISALLLGRGARQDVFTAAFLGDLPLLDRLVFERPSLAQVPDPATDVLTITPVVFQKFPIVQPAEKGVYWWCACGQSKTQPFCDGSHKGSEFTPVKTEIAEKKTVAWCGCKHSKNKPFCDGSHARL